MKKIVLVKCFLSCIVFIVFMNSYTQDNPPNTRDSTQLCDNYDYFSELRLDSFDEFVDNIDSDEGLYSALSFDLNTVELIGPATYVTQNNNVSTKYNVYYPTGNKANHSMYVFVLVNGRPIPAFNDAIFLDLELIPGDRLSFDVKLEGRTGLNDIVVLEIDNFRTYDRSNDDSEAIRLSLFVDEIYVQSLDYTTLQEGANNLASETIMFLSTHSSSDISNLSNSQDEIVEVEPKSKIYATFSNFDDPSSTLGGSKLGFLSLVSDADGNLVSISETDYLSFSSHGVNGVHTFSLEDLVESGTYSLFGVRIDNPGQAMCVLASEGLQSEVYVDTLKLKFDPE